MPTPLFQARTSHWALVLVGLIVLPCGCSDSTPTSSEILQYGKVSECIVEGSHIRGIYVNYDVDTLIFAYTTNIQVPDEFWKALSDRLTKAGWVARGDVGIARRFQRIIAQSAEEVRITFQNADRRVTVAWVQADESSSVDDFEQTDESSFARAVVWPRFERETAR